MFGLDQNLTLKTFQDEGFLTDLSILSQNNFTFRNLNH